jgi:RNA polymerase sigma-70 factor (ECF subfamily)
MVNWKTVFSHVRSALMRRGRTQHEAEDLVQEAWVRLACYERDHVVENSEAFLMRTALNLSIDAHRTKTSHGEEVAFDDVVIVDLAPGVDAILLGKQRIERLAACLGRLPDRTREIFLAHRVDGRNYTDIGRELGISATAVEKHVAKATLQVACWMEGW